MSQTIRKGQKLVETWEVEYRVTRGASTEARFKQIGRTTQPLVVGHGSSVDEARDDLLRRFVKELDLIERGGLERNGVPSGA